METFVNVKVEVTSGGIAHEMQYSFEDDGVSWTLESLLDGVSMQHQRQYRSRLLGHHL
jgi:hypothetical protein